MQELEIIKVLKEMNIVDEYILLSKNQQVKIKELFRKYDNKKVLEIFDKLGYVAKYVKSENFFKISYDDYKGAKFQLNLILKSGIIDIVFCVWWQGEILTGVPMCMLIDEVSGQEHDTIRPMFRDYVELEEILLQVLSLFDDFRMRVINKLND